MPICQLKKNEYIGAQLLHYVLGLFCHNLGRLQKGHNLCPGCYCTLSIPKTFTIKLGKTAATIQLRFLRGTQSQWLRSLFLMIQHVISGCLAGISFIAFLFPWNTFNTRITSDLPCNLCSSTEKTINSLIWELYCTSGLTVTLKSCWFQNCLFYIMCKILSL